MDRKNKVISRQESRFHGQPQDFQMFSSREDMEKWAKENNATIVKGKPAQQK